MKLCQFQLAGGARRVGVLDGEAVIDITTPRAGVASVLDLLRAGRTPAGIERLAGRLARAPRRPRHPWAALDRAPRGRAAGLLAPLDPPEVWGAGITYRRSREYYSEHDTGQAHRGKGIYDYVYEAERPELFYKGSAARSVGPHGAVGVRGDSKLTVVEAELAVVVGAGGGIVGYTVGNDMSAWDIERENPLFLPQSKIFQGSFGFGPVIATPASIPDPHALTIRCVIERAGRPLFEGRASTGDLKRRVEELVDWLCRYNPVPPGTVLSTGTGILVPDQHALAPGDVVTITIDGIGTLRNPVRRLD
ncbi:MAG TPA: fumarylacetoacetate hydrolase family protein [Methylomirabilota bacterium]|jgi:2-dehydro-3-deoxy-D-arabinonate dehydratase